MGLDVNLYAVGDFTDEELEAAEQYMRARVPGIRWENNPILERSWRSERAIINVYTYQRYYGPGYERGDWPLIHAAIVCLRAALPHCDIRYGSDLEAKPALATDWALDAIWQHFLGPDGNAYSEQNARWGRGVRF